MKQTEVVVEQLRYKFTPEEHLKNCEDLASKLDFKSELEDDNAAIKSDLSKREKAVEAEIGKLTRMVRDKYELRPIECRWDYNVPADGQKSLVRLDNEEVVRVERMMEHERQDALAFVEGPVEGEPVDAEFREVDEVPGDTLASARTVDGPKRARGNRREPVPNPTAEQRAELEAAGWPPPEEEPPA